MPGRFSVGSGRRKGAEVWDQVRMFRARRGPGGTMPRFSRNGDGDRRLPEIRPPPSLSPAAVPCAARVRPFSGPNAFSPRGSSPRRIAQFVADALPRARRHDRGTQDVGIRDPLNQFPDLTILPWPTGTAPPRQAGPMRRESLSMPADDAIGLHDDQRLPPVRPGARQEQPEDSI